MLGRDDIEVTVDTSRIPERYAKFCHALAKRLQCYNEGLQRMPGPHSEQLVRFVSSCGEFREAIREILTEDERSFILDALLLLTSKHGAGRRN
jgi:hypothetical protein